MTYTFVACLSQHTLNMYTPRVGIAGAGKGLNPQFMSTVQTLIFEWKSALNFNPWAKFQTFRHLTP